MSTWLDFNDGQQREVVDGDGLRGKDGTLGRIAGLDTYEVGYEKGDLFSTNQGLEQKRILHDVINDKGFKNYISLGQKAASQKNYKGNSERELIRIEDDDGISIASKLYYEGLAVPRGSNVSPEDVQIWKQGIYARERNPDSQDPYYAKLREDLNISSQLDVKFAKTKAVTERDYKPQLHSGVVYKHSDRNKYNEAKSPFKSAFSSGLDGIQSGYYGIMEMTGARLDIESLEKYGRQGKELQARQMGMGPRWVNNIDEIDSLKDFTSWASGALGGSLPYFGIMAAGFIPGLAPYSITSMALTYAGQTWNEMEGTPDENSASVALFAGALQSAWERIGGRAVFTLVKPQDLATRKGVNKAIDELVKSGKKSTKTGKVLTKTEAKAVIEAGKREEILRLLKDFNQNSAIWAAYSAQVAKRAGAGVIGEGTTEGMQEATQIIGAYLGTPESKRKFNFEDVRNEDGQIIEYGFTTVIKNAIAAGALLGGGMSGAQAAFTEKQPYSTSVRQDQYLGSKNTTVDLSPVQTMNEVLDEMATRHLDPNEIKQTPLTANASTRKDQEAIPLDSEVSQKVVDKALNLAGSLKTPRRADVDNVFLNVIKENFGEQYVGVYLRALYNKVNENISNSDISSEEKTKFVEANNKRLESDLKDFYGEDSSTQETEETNIPTKNETNAQEVLGWVNTHQRKLKEISGTSRAADFLLKGKWISAPMQVTSIELGNVWNNLTTLRAEGEYIGSPFGRTIAGETMPQQRRNMEGQAHEQIQNTLDYVISHMRTRGKPLRNTDKNRAIVFNAIKDYIVNGKIDPKYKGLEVVFGTALNEIHQYEQSQAELIREVDTNYSVSLEEVDIVQPDGSVKEEDWSLGIFFNNKLSSKKVLDNKEVYINAMVANGHSKADAEFEYEKIKGTPTGWDYQEWADTQFLIKKPAYLKKRIDYNDEAFKDLWEANDYEATLTRATEIAHYVTDMKSKGFGGSRLNSKILSIRDEVLEKYGQEGVDQYMPLIAHELYRHQELHMGEYHKIKSETGRAVAAHTGSILSFAFMAMAVISSLPELALMFRDTSGLTVNGERMFVKATKNLAKLTKQSMVSQMKKIHNAEGNWADTAFLDKMYKRQVARGMTGKEYTAGHIVDAEYGMDRKHWMQAKAMPAFYKWTGLTPYTTFVRMGRDSIADDWLAVQFADTTDLIIKTIKQWEDNYRKNNVLPENATEQQVLDYENTIDVERINLLDTGRFENVEKLQRLVSQMVATNKEAIAFEKLRNAGVDPVDTATSMLHLEEWFTSAKMNIYGGNTGKGRYNNILVVDPILENNPELVFDEWLNALSKSDAKELKYIKDIGTRLAKNLDIARGNFVDQALVNPDPGKRPPMYSDGRTRLLFMFQGYLAQFSSKIARPILRDLVGKGTPEAQVNAAAVMMGAVAIAFLAQALKDEVKYGDKPSWLSDAEYIQRGIMASGLMGQTERIFNFIFPLYKSEEDNLADKFWAEFGPITGAVDSLIKGSKWASEGEGERALNQYLKVTPAGTFTQQRQFMAKLLAGNLNDGE